jgi:hypothetical protein
MEFGRWCPSLVTLGAGNVVAVSGLGDNHRSVIPERFDAATSTWSRLPEPGPIPMNAHLVLLDDGRVFYTGGQYGGNNGGRPSIWYTATGQRTEVLGLTDPALRRQSASALLPAAQDQRVLILGGGGVSACTVPRFRPSQPATRQHAGVQAAGRRCGIRAGRSARPAPARERRPARTVPADQAASKIEASGSICPAVLSHALCPGEV